MSESETQDPRNFLKKGDLKYGEAYRTTKAWTWSDYDKKMAKVIVPADELLIYRISESVRKDAEHVMFVWLSQRITICLLATETAIIYVRHRDWDERHNSLNITEREDDTGKIKLIPRGTFGEDSATAKNESRDS